MDKINIQICQYVKTPVHNAVSAAKNITHNEMHITET